MKAKFDEERARLVFEILDKGWQEKKGVFKGITLPQDRWPLPDNPKEMALFLFYSAIFMRGGVISEDPMRILFVLKQDNPNIFNPIYVSKNLNPLDIEKVLEKAVPLPISKNRESSGKSNANKYKLSEHSRSWHHNSTILEDNFLGNPLQIFEGVSDFEEAFSRIDKVKQKKKGILGMRRKIFSLLTIWLQEKNLIPLFPTPIPVDFHALRILWATRIVSFPGVKTVELQAKHGPSLEGKRAIRITERVVDEIALWSQKFLYESRLCHLNINPALWILSRDLCVRSYPNSSFRENGVIYLRNPEKLGKHTDWPAIYRDPCFFCPISEYCDGAIPAAPYYKWGLLTRLQRTPYPSVQPLFPGVDWLRYSRIPKSKRSQA